MAISPVKPLANGTTPQNSTPIQVSMALPNAPGSRIHMHLSILATSILLFLTSTTGDTTSNNIPSLGSFVYAMPDRYNPSNPLSTPLYTLPSSLDFADRLAKVLARKTGRAVQVGSSVSFSSAGNGGSVEEEMEAFRQVVGVVVSEVEKSKSG